MSTAKLTEVILGVDTHLDVHVGALINVNGQLLGTLAVETQTRGYLKLLTWTRSFGRLLTQESIWTCVSELLECASSDLLFHFCNLTRKPSAVGPAIGWHRDADNKYFASRDGRTLRLLIPLQFMSARNGGTAVVPGSHIQIDAPIETALYPDVAPGACLALHSATLHGGSPNRSEQERDVIVIQFGLCSSILRCQADETLSLSTRKDLLAFYLGTVERLIENS